jgi:ribosomal protein L29
MADKKTTVKKPVVKKNAVEVKTIDTMRADLTTKQQDLLQSKRGNAAGELTNPHVITVTRKEIARLHTAIRAAELSELKEKK